MADSTQRPTPEAQAEQRIQEILRAADSWSREAPGALRPAIRAVCIRLAEMVADQRNYLAPLPEPQETEQVDQAPHSVTSQAPGGHGGDVQL